MNELKTKLLANKKTTGLGLMLLLLVLFGGNFIFQKFFVAPSGPVEEVDLIFDAEGPYALLHPRKDGHALNLGLIRTSSYDSISYELAYTSSVDQVTMSGSKVLKDSDDGEAPSSETIDRGTRSTIDTKERKGEYEQEILFGSCSSGGTCVYDKDVENGTLTLHIKKGNKVYRMITQWHLQQPDVDLGELTSGDNHFSYKLNESREVLSNVGFSIINDLTGVPKLPNSKQVVGKVYALNVPIAKNLPAGDVTLELAENPSPEAKIYRHQGSEWKELDTKIEGSKLSARAEGAGIFAVLTSKK